MAYRKTEELPPFPHHKDVNGAPMPHDIHVVNGSSELFRFPVYLIEEGKREAKPLDEIWSTYDCYSDLTILADADDGNNILVVSITAEFEDELQEPSEWKAFPYNIIGTRTTAERDCILRGNIIVHGAPYEED